MGSDQWIVVSMEGWKRGRVEGKTVTSGQWLVWKDGREEGRKTRKPTHPDLRYMIINRHVVGLVGSAHPTNVLAVSAAAGYALRIA